MFTLVNRYLYNTYFKGFRTLSRFCHTENQNLNIKKKHKIRIHPISPDPQRWALFFTVHLLDLYGNVINYT